MPGMARSPVTLDPAEERSREALNVIMRLLDLSDQQLADKVGRKRQTVEQRRSGFTRIRPGDVDTYAEALGLPADLWRMERPDILRWFAEHPDFTVIRFGWMHRAA